MAPPSRSRRMRIGLAGGFAIVGLAACGSTASRPSVDACSSGWAPVGQINEDLFVMPRAMVWQDGVLYQATLNGVLAMPEDGGDGTELTNLGRATGVWIVGDDVLYSFEDLLFAVPRAGGDATLLLDGGQQNDPSTGSDEYDHVGERQYLDGGAFYWTTTAYPYATDGSHVWRMLRAGDAVEGFALLPIQTVEALTVLPEGVLAVGQSASLGGPFYRAFLAPSANGAAREIPLSPSPDKIVSAADGALLWSVYTGSREGGHETHEVWILPAGGSTARRLSRSLPVEFLANWSVPNERGGYVVGGVEPFDDGNDHASVFQVNGDGDATRLACDPSLNWPVYTATAFASDAIYLSVMYDQRGWLLVRLPR